MKGLTDSAAGSSGPTTPTDAGTAGAAPRRGQLKLLVLAALFFGPVLVAFVLYYGGLGDRLVGGDVSHGDLVLPTEPMPSLAELPLVARGRVVTEEPLRRYWNIVQVTGDGCGEACSAALADSARVRALLVKELDRVGRVLIVSGGELPDVGTLRQQHPDLAIIDARRLGAGDEVFERLAWDGTEGVAHLTDPLTNVVLRYGADVDRMGMFHDLKRLLKLSRIG